MSCASKAKTVLFLVFSLLKETPHTSSDYQTSHSALPGTSDKGPYVTPKNCTTGSLQGVEHIAWNFVCGKTDPSREQEQAPCRATQSKQR